MMDSIRNAGVCPHRLWALAGDNQSTALNITETTTYWNDVKYQSESKVDEINCLSWPK